MAITLNPPVADLGIMAPALGPWFSQAVTLDALDPAKKLGLTVNFAAATDWYAPVTGTLSLEIDNQYLIQLSSDNTNWTEVGRETFVGACAKCHGLAGQGDIGPPIAQSALLADRRGLTALIRNGGIKMPAVGKTWGDGQLNATLDYLRERFKAGGSGG